MSFSHDKHCPGPEVIKLFLLNSTVGILTFMSMKNCMLIGVEHEKSFITSGSGYIFIEINKWLFESAVAQCLTRDRGAVGSSLTRVTVLWSLSKTHLS